MPIFLIKCLKKNINNEENQYKSMFETLGYIIKTKLNIRIYFLEIHSISCLILIIFFSYYNFDSFLTLNFY